MESSLAVLVIAAVMAGVAVVQSIINNRAATARQAADWARQDDVATRADERADIVAGQVAETARLQKMQNEKVATSTAATNDKLDEIHVAVNSNLMKAQVEALEAKEMLVIVMAQMVQDIRDKGDVPPDDTLEYIKKTQKRTMELRSQLYPARG